MLFIESSDEIYNPYVISEPSITESINDESFSCYKIVDDEFYLNTRESSLKLKCAQSGSFYKISSYEFSSIVLYQIESGFKDLYHPCALSFRYTSKS